MVRTKRATREGVGHESSQRGGPVRDVGRPCGGGPLPNWLGVDTGPGGYSVDLTADVTTITNTAAGYIVTGTESLTFDLANVTGLFVETDFASPCEFDLGCIISAPLSFTVDGMAGELRVYGDFLSLNGNPLFWDLNPNGTPNGFVSGELMFASAAGFTDNQETISIAAVPEPPSWSMLEYALLALAIRPRRARLPLS